jgi:hypothetical protein
MGFARFLAFDNGRIDQAFPKMNRGHTNASGALLKAFIIVVAVAAVAIGLALPVPRASQAAQPTKSQFRTLDLG